MVTVADVLLRRAIQFAVLQSASDGARLDHIIAYQEKTPVAEQNRFHFEQYMRAFDQERKHCG